MKITKQRLKEIIKEELDDKDPIIMVPGYGQLLRSQVKKKLAKMLEEAAEDAERGIREYPHFKMRIPHLDGGVIQAFHKALKESESE